MENFKRNFYYLIGRTYIPKKLVNYRGKILLHVSDTPTNFYSNLKIILNKLKPNYIVHTGDLVDNIKLEIYPKRINNYIMDVKRLIFILEDSSADKIFLALGNHDNKAVIDKLVKRCEVVEQSKEISIGNLKVKISHYSSEIIKSPADINLFGHDLSLKSTIKGSKVFLNGITSINILLLDNLEVINLPYPFGTNSSRLCKGKIGI